MPSRLRIDARYLPEAAISEVARRNPTGLHRRHLADGTWELFVDAPEDRDAARRTSDVAYGLLEAASAHSGRAFEAWWAPHRVGDSVVDGVTLVDASESPDGSGRLRFRLSSGTSVDVDALRRVGAPLGPAHTADLDFRVRNDGSGKSPTDPSLARALVDFARVLDTPALAERRAQRAAAAGHTPAPRVDVGAEATGDGACPEPRIEAGAVVVDADLETALPRLFSAVLSVRSRALLSLTTGPGGRQRLVLTPYDPHASSALVDELRRAMRAPSRGDADREPPRPLPEALRRELASMDVAAYGLGAEPPPAPDHGALRVLHLRGTGACDSDCLFCVEKFEPTHGAMPTTDRTREILVEGAPDHDVLFFASGEPTLHPRLFEHASLARSLGYRHLGMSSHFRRLRDPEFTWRVLDAGFRFFDISLHAADAPSQAFINPVGDDGKSLEEALAGLAVLVRLAAERGVGVHITHKLVLSGANVGDLEAIVAQTYARGVRRFLIQPVHLEGLDQRRAAPLRLSREVARSRLSALFAYVGGLPGARIKPYGFADADVPWSDHVVPETNRVKNRFGKSGATGRHPRLPPSVARTPGADGPYVTVIAGEEGRFGFPGDRTRPILDRALELGAELKHGCRMGSCGMCAARLVAGRVDPGEPFFLDGAQREAGYVLLCQARPEGDVTVALCDESEIDDL